MENLKEGMYFSYLNEGSNYLTRIFVFGIYLLLGIPLFQIMITLNELLHEYLNPSSDFLNFIHPIINYTTSFLVTLLLPFLYIFTQWDLKNPGVFYSKNTLIVFRDEKEGEIEIPLQMIKRFLLYQQKTVIIKYHEGFLGEMELPRDKKPSPLGEFNFTLDKKYVKIGPSLIDELNKKLQ